jgi:alpha-L-fucosidase
MNRRLILLLITVLAMAGSRSVATATEVEKDERMAWWREAKFGMFVHWGVYSVTGGEFRGKMPTNSAEWMMNKARISIADYKTENVDQFNPTQFDADAFVGLARKAGMKYLVITAKHHDGFSMFHSKASPYNVVDATPFKRDIMKELADACQKQGIRFGFYYSQCQDWHHPGGQGNNWDKTIKRVSFDEYVREKAVPEVRQLLTEYGPIAIFWWDTPRAMSKEAIDSLYSTRLLQPGLITNDRLGEGYPGDHMTYERTIPQAGPDDQDWEVCMPISASWGYKKSDTDFKSTITLIRNLADIASKGGNYLLNVSPTGEGTLLPQAVERLEAIGAWMNVNSDSIYGTVASPFAKLKWGRCTMKVSGDETTLYLHVFDWPAKGELLVPGLESRIQGASLLADQSVLETRQTDSGVLVSLPPEAPDAMNSVIELKLQGPLKVATGSAMQQDGLLVLSAEEACINNNEGSQQIVLQKRDDYSNIGCWNDAHASVHWIVAFSRPGEYEMIADLAVEAEKSRFRIGVKGSEHLVDVASTGGFYIYDKKSIGTITVQKAGTLNLKINPDPEHWQPINIRQLELRLR